MDELLSLMVADVVPEGTTTEKNHEVEVTEEVNPKCAVVVTPPTTASSLKGRISTQVPNGSISNSNSPSSSSSSSRGIDDKCPYSKYNIARREASSQEVTNILESSNCTFIPLPRLSTMSHRSVENQRATSPIATIGIVNSSTGTRLSKGGNAYAILEIASIYRAADGRNPECLPMISLFLFGQAYSAFTLKIQVADVVLILDPTSLPQNGSEGNKNSYSKNKKTLQSFKIYDETQLRRIGISTELHQIKKVEAMAKTAKAKQPSKSASTAPTNKFQKLKHAHNPYSTNKPMFHHSNTTVATFHHHVLDNTHRGRAVAVASRKPLLDVTSKMVYGKKLGSIMDSRVNICGSRLNSLPACQLPNTGIDRHKVIKTPLSRPLPHQQRRELAASLFEDNFDGSVPIPKPNAHLLLKRPLTDTYLSASATTTSTNDVATPRKDKVDSILKTQRIIAAELLQAKQEFSHTTAPTMKAYKETMQLRPVPKKPILIGKQGLKIGNDKDVTNNCKAANDCETERVKEVEVSSSILFGSESDAIDTASILAAKSLFSDDLSAHVYAKSRQCVLELEQKEDFAAMTKKKKTQAGTAGTKKILTEYICETCHFVHAGKPFGCIAAGHIVKKRRKLEETKVDVTNSTNLKKILLNKQGTSDSDLQLGQGLEWSGWFNR
jgi:hypothetical protein